MMFVLTGRLHPELRSGVNSERSNFLKLEISQDSLKIEQSKHLWDRYLNREREWLQNVVFFDFEVR